MVLSTVDYYYPWMKSQKKSSKNKQEMPKNHLSNHTNKQGGEQNIKINELRIVLMLSNEPCVTQKRLRSYKTK